MTSSVGSAGSTAAATGSGAAATGSGAATGSDSTTGSGAGSAATTSGSDCLGFRRHSGLGLRLDDRLGLGLGGGDCRDLRCGCDGRDAGSEAATGASARAVRSRRRLVRLVGLELGVEVLAGAEPTQEAAGLGRALLARGLCRRLIVTCRVERDGGSAPCRKTSRDVGVPIDS